MTALLNCWEKAVLIVLLAIALILSPILCLPSANAQPSNIHPSNIQPNNIQPAIDLSLFGEALPENFFPEQATLNPALIDLGRDLYYEKRLSKHEDISCNSCHPLTQYGVDHQPRSLGDRGQLGDRNAPTVYNAAPHIAQFWDGRAADVEEQAKGPILNPVEMAMLSPETVVEWLKSTPTYVAAFQQAFPNEADPIAYDNLGKAIGAFERGLVTPAPFDAYRAGNDTALTEQQKRGLQLFTSIGCIGCHNGTYLGGQSYQKLGLVQPWPNQADQGRYPLTQQDTDRMVFKVPSLRNVAKTYPYFHDASATTLYGAIRLMARHQLGRELTAAQADDLVAFLKSLTGNLPLAYIQAPTTPDGVALSQTQD